MEAGLFEAPHAAEAEARLPLFRPITAGEREFGEALAFATPHWRTLGWLALSAVLLLLGFGLAANFDDVATVRGVIVPESGVARMTASRPGIVTEVLIRQDEEVERGSPLIRIASADHLPDGAASSSRILETYRRQQLIAQAALAAEDERRAVERRRLAEQERELTSALDSAHIQSSLQLERIRRAEQRLGQLAPLAARGYVSTFSFQQQEETVLALRQEAADLRHREAAAAGALSAARLRMVELAAEGRQAQLQSRASRLELDRGAAGARAQAEATLVAPVAGRIAALRAIPGMSVAAADELATIVHAGDAMEVLLFVPPASAGALRPGQEVVLRFDAFPSQRHGVGHGVVTQIAATASVEQPGQPAAYRVKVRLLDGRDFALRPDMTLTAAIKVERRSLLDWLLAPLRRRRDAGETRTPG